MNNQVWVNPLELQDAIGLIFSHNEEIALYRPDPSGEHVSVEIWRGMAHQLPEEYSNVQNWRIFGLIHETLDESCIINIQLAE